MRKVLSLLGINNKFDVDDGALKEVEFFYPEENEQVSESIARFLKLAVGKYVVIIDEKFSYNNLYELVKELNTCNADMIICDKCTFFKTTLVKNVALNKTLDTYSFNILSAMLSKNVVKKDWSYIKSEKTTPIYIPERAEQILACAVEFNKVKAKLTKEMYSYVFDSLCYELIKFYMLAMICKDKTAREYLLEFDKRLKEHIVLYLAIEKRFPLASLSTLRRKQFKISLITLIKFKKYLNKMM
jgi:hypothetical protein